MRNAVIKMNWRPLMSAAFFGAMLVACGKPESAQVAAPEAAPIAADAIVAAPASPVAKTPASMATSEPALATMQVARSDAKIGVPVDLRYQFDGEVVAGQPVTLHLAAVPRVAGTNLAVSIQQDPGIELPKERLNADKFSAATAYRQQLRVMRRAGGPQELRVLVTMDYPIGTGFSYFTVPFGAAPAKSKQANDRVE